VLQIKLSVILHLPDYKAIVATSPMALRWLCDSPRTGCAWRITPLYMQREQAMIREIASMISIVACCRGAKLCAHAARDFRSQHNQQYHEAPWVALTVRSMLLKIKFRH